MNLHTGGGIKSCRISEWVLISVATTSRLPSTSSPNVQMSIDKEAKSPQVGINTSVNSIGLPKSKVTNLLAPIREREEELTKTTTVSTHQKMHSKTGGNMHLKNMKSTY